jgi:hypothetical protein
VTHLYLSVIRERQGDDASALAEARAAAEQSVGPYLRQTALGQCAHLLVRLGRLDEAEEAAEAIDDEAPELVESDLFAGFAAYGKAEVHWARGREDSARSLLGRMLRAIHGWAAALPPELRAVYLERPHPNREIMELGRVWGLAGD